MFLNTYSDPAKRGVNKFLLAGVFFLVAAAGLYYVKWHPYYLKAFKSATTHSIGASIITGKAASAPVPSWNAAVGYAAAYFKAVWQAVVLGLMLGSLVQVLIPRDWVKRVLGSTGFGSTVAGGAVALPGMMCTCCAAPVTVGLRKRSASVGAALAFFLANPVLNPATLIFMGFVLSWKFTIYRLVFGVILVFGIALLANRLFKEEQAADSPLSTVDEAAAETGSFLRRWLRALGQLIIDTIPAYVIVVFVLGFARAWLFPAIGPTGLNGILAIIGLAIAGTLFVIPTAAEIPVVQTLMGFGLGAGPAGALLLTLPAVSLPSLLIVKRGFSARVLVFTAVAVAVLGIVGGLVAGVVL